jgi:hypothetical protein
MRDYEEVSNTFVSKETEPQVEVGDIKQPDFYPQLKLKRWGNEVNFSLRLLDTLDGEAAVSVFGESVKWKKPHIEARFYAIGWGIDNGSFEFEIQFPRRPASDQLRFSVQSKGLDFFYQPELTQAEIDEGGYRPDNVVGSYAVYHKTRTNVHRNQADAVKYKAGKAFHIYRPKLIDAAGNEIWANLDISDGILTITMDAAWLDNAVYPVVVDPNFGYETSGGSNTTYGYNQLHGSVFNSPTDVDTASSLTFYTAGAITTINCKGVIVLHSSLVIISNGVGNGVSCPTTPGWRTSTMGTPPSLSGSTDYVLMWIDDGGGATWGVIQYWDTGDTDQGHHDTSNNYGTPTDPTDATHDTKKFSVYCTYVAAAGGSGERSGGRGIGRGIERGA